MREPLPYHVVKKKEWVEGARHDQIQSYIGEMWCGRTVVLSQKRKGAFKMVDVKREERKKYKKKICQDCIAKAISKTTK